MDLADDNRYIGREVKVKEELGLWLLNMIDLYDELDTDANCGRNHECLLIPFNSFTQGYISSLPMYSSNVILAMLKTKYLEIVKNIYKAGYSEFCLLEDSLSADNWHGS
ncbi:hypothetical protein [Endozoicomonas sp. ALB032]|uniref:hypothetical protein n=1 Tax=Endozoicomonas sp. ALB032 TaxID=3403082 RepID=UPI003BB4F163